MPRTSAGPRIHLRYVDGIRGLAALYVLIEHAQLEGLAMIDGDRGGGGGNATTIQRLAHLLNAYGLGFGHFAVDVFIVLSGFCLMLPVAASGEHRLRGGLRAFLKRRALRILPPYYVALLIAIGAYAFFNDGKPPATANWVSHVFLIHNFWPAWIYGITPPLWSVAIEWQIYFLFALVLLPICRRAGSATTISVAAVLGILPLYVMPADWDFEWSCPWYILLFAFGMVAATLAMPSRCGSRRRLNWGLLAVAFLLAAIFTLLLQRIAWTRPYFTTLLKLERRGGSWLLDVFVGLAACATLLSLALSTSRGDQTLASTIKRVLESRPVSGLGTFSYSLYLIHAPVIALLARGVQMANLPPVLGYTTIYAIGIPLGLGVAYLFYLAVERRCLPSRTSDSGREGHEQARPSFQANSIVSAPASVAPSVRPSV